MRHNFGPSSRRRKMPHSIIALFTLIFFSISSESTEAFRFSFFESSGNSISKKENAIFRHPSSPSEIDPRSSAFRAKRQAYKVSVGGDSITITTDKAVAQVGSESGAWGEWTKARECSRSCGGGVLVEERQCNNECTGSSTRFVSCNLEECPTKADFRAEQCASHNDDSIDGTYFKWIPYPGKNKCELTCKPDTANFYYKWADKVIDGTSCGDDAVCVDGICLPLGCDGRLGSVAKKDKCGVCNGNETTCKTMEGLFDERNLKAGYHDVIELPIGATGIKIEELQPTTNNLAIKNSSGHFYLNGNYQINLLDKETIIAGGTPFKYSKAQSEGQPEKLTAVGPLEEQLTIALLFQPTATSKSSGVKYEYSIPLEDEIPYYYKPGEWSSCSVTCGKGIQTRTPYCIDALTQARVEDQLCDENNATKPEFEKPCETVHCDAKWFTGEWEECSESCGNNGWQYRIVYCHKIFSDGRKITVSDENCTESSKRPIVKQTCNRFSCPEWHAGPWSACSEKCGDAKQYRSVTCRSEKEGEEGKLLPASHCPANVEELESERSCNLGPCEGLHFQISDWNLCQRCNDTQETRNVTCRDQSGRVFPPEKCLNGTINEIPPDTRSCATNAPCIYEWHTSQWSKCSTECGHGHKNRKVHCAINELGDIEVVDESLCLEDKPTEKEECVNEAKCTGTYFTGPWSNCSKECGNGTHSRIVVCLNYDRKPVPEWCDESTKPVEEESCNPEPCPICETSEFGCCPDNSTFATGPFFEGCSNCFSTKFGCCADNYTTASGPNAKGCPESETFVEGSGEEESEDTKQIVEAQKDCEVTEEKTGTKVTVPCSATIPPPIESDDEVSQLLFNDIESENTTIKHCSKTEFGCCPDWYTPAEAPDKAGCPEIKLGACNGTKYGCCLDGVTLARGADFQGCGEPTCAASLYGCCKDRRTIAFGPHYSGCERSSFPCEISNFGCCPDGETAALDKNYTGCGASCLLTKFGCCPDMKTHAKGLNNEGCGCEYAQYGCCPDGKSAAQGPGFYGCPATCAQSQFGCCPDGKTPARGANKEGCPCQYTRWGCCPDGETTAFGPRNDGCDDCRYAKYGCCSDGVSKAIGPNFAGCPTTTPAPFIIGGTVSPQKIVACNLPQDVGSVCNTGYRTRWYYNTMEGRCAQFWYGGCGGNDNNYGSKEECEQICVEPPHLGRCYLPKVDGSKDCAQLSARYWYDYTTRQCAAFWYRGCLGNANNFETWEQCETFCSSVSSPPIDPIQQQQRQPQQQQQRQEHEQQQQQQQSYTPYGPPSLPPQQRPILQQYPNYPVQVFSQYTPTAATISESARQIPEIHSHQSQFQIQRQQVEREYVERPVHDQQPVRIEQTAQRTSQVLPYHSQTQSPIQSHRERQHIEDPCRQSVDSGNCRNYHQQWYFDTLTAKCYNFLYSGCDGNTNRYASQAECEHRCAHLISQAKILAQITDATFVKNELTAPAFVPTAKTIFEISTVKPFRRRFKTTTKSREICSLRLDIGRCEGHFDSWYYEVATGLCEQFQYSGCGGNPNRFHTKEQCENVCVRQSVEGSYSSATRNGMSAFAPPSVNDQSIGIIGNVLHKVNKFKENIKSAVGIQSVCDLNKDTGTCSRFEPKWFYNKADGTCTRFHYGGCDGNGNRFDTEEECKKTCGNHIDACQLPKISGPCAANLERFYYDSATRRCTPFSYGGCLGNTNNFVSIHECATRCPAATASLVMPKSLKTASTRSLRSFGLNDHYDIVEFRKDICQLSLESGPCLANIPSYYYNTLLERCVEFMYGGCFGNDNRFSSKLECETRCMTRKYQKDEFSTKSFIFKRLPREQPMIVYPIENSSYYYTQPIPAELFADSQNINGSTINNEESSNIDTNNYVDENAENDEDETNMIFPENPELIPDLCMLPEERGPCYGEYLRWYYNSEERRCTSFLYTGCKPNANHFMSIEACERACGAYRNQTVCHIKYDVGECVHENEARLTRWFYDLNLHKCQPFIWSGCGGNGNRFVSRAECENLCSREERTFESKEQNESISICELERDSGPCSDQVTQWYYNASEGDCRPFTYGGCRGNANRFNSKMICQKSCDNKAPYKNTIEPDQIIQNTIGPDQIIHQSGVKLKINKSRLRANVHAQHLGAYLVGKTVELRCDPETENYHLGTQNIRDTPIYTWYWNEAELRRDKFADEFDKQRISFKNGGQILRISNSKILDSGNYSCAIGENGFISRSYPIKVQEASYGDCIDRGTRATCTLVRRTGLCATARYGGFCCLTCSMKMEEEAS